jgi:thymidine phosphorylase
LSEAAWDRLGVAEGDLIQASHPKALESLRSVRRRIYGHRLDEAALHAIMSDVVKGRYSDVHLSSFITACAAVPLDQEETVALTRVMVQVGERLTWAWRTSLVRHLKSEPPQTHQTQTSHPFRDLVLRPLCATYSQDMVTNLRTW